MDFLTPGLTTYLYGGIIIPTMGRSQLGGLTRAPLISFRTPLPYPLSIAPVVTLFYMGFSLSLHPPLFLLPISYL